MQSACVVHDSGADIGLLLWSLFCLHFFWVGHSTVCRSLSSLANKIQIKYYLFPVAAINAACLHVDCKIRSCVSRGPHEKKKSTTGMGLG